MKVLIMRLSPFRDVVKSTPHQFLYGECARVLPDEDIDFVFLPNAAERERLSTLRGLRTGLEASKFDLILVSNSYAVELVNLPSMLRYAHIPYRHSQRVPDASAPLIVMGGSNAMASQGVLYSADDAFVDALYFGEGEGNTTRLVSALLKTPRNQWRQVLSSLEGEIDGLMVVGNSHTSVRKAILPDTSHDWLSTARQYLFDSPEATTARLQISYGCPYFCTFCFEGWERKPYREVPYEELERAARQLKRATGSDTLEITSFNFNTHHDVVRLMGGLTFFYKTMEFLNMIRMSDDALEDLVTYFQNVDDPTVIVFFGDHQPDLDESIYKVIMGGEKSVDELEGEELEQLYKVPFMIWANYDIEEKTVERTSNNYLSTYLADVTGMKKTGYLQYLSDLREKVPCINAIGYWGDDGNFYELDDKTSPYYELIHAYHFLEYNNLFGKENQVSTFFYLPGQENIENMNFTINNTSKGEPQ